VQDATQTDATATSEPAGSTTEQPQADADPLDAASTLGDTSAATAEGGDGEGGGDAGGEKGGEVGGEAEAPALTGAPEGDYDLTGLLPEGTTIDPDAMAKIAPTAKELNLSNAGLARIAAEGLPIVQGQVMSGIVGDVVAQRAAWDQATRASISGGKDASGAAIAADPAFGGKSFDDVSGIAAKALDRFAGDRMFPAAKADGSEGTFRDFLKTTGLGNHPAMMRFAYLAGSAISEDNDFQRGGGIPNTPKSREEKYYGSGAE
jgi:hypothetical protein